MPIFKKSLLIFGFWLIATILTGCTAIGSSKPAALQVTSTPEASVFLDGKHVGKSPFFSDQLQAREYLIKLTSGEASYSVKVTLTEGTLTVVNRELTNNFLAQSGEVLWLEEGNRGLFLISMPDQATISLDGQIIGTTPQKVDEIEQGEHKVTISKLGYIDREFSIKTSNEYQLVASVNLASEIAKGAVTAPSPLPEPEKVEVLTTPQGFLRVRKEPSTSASEIGRVKDGDKLELIQETKGWFEIKFEGKQGWVSSQYVKKL